MGSTVSGNWPVLFWMKTLALGLATMTRAGGTTTRPDCVRSSAASGTGGGTGAERAEIEGGAVGNGAAPTVGTDCEGDLRGKSGVVLAEGGEPVKGGAEDFGGCGVSCTGDGGGTDAVGVFEILGIGFVTAVDQAGGTLLDGAGTGVSWPELCIGSVVAAETFGLGVGVIFPVAGRKGRGGRLMRSVSRFGAFGSLPSGVGVSAIDFAFYSYFGKMFNGEIRNGNVFMQLSAIGSHVLTPRTNFR
jgi:hypothetical protein